MPDLGTVWFVLVTVLLAGYAVLDGFDLGAGVLHLFVARTDAERRVVLSAIAPVWDANEVWLLAGAGALFAAFPAVYATLLSGLYVPFVLVLAGLVVRAVSVEFRSKEPGPAWRRFWDLAFAAGSFVPALVFGVAAGNVLRGVPIGPDGEFGGRLSDLVHPFCLGVGLFGLSLFVLQGASWLVLKTEGALARRARIAALAAYALSFVLWLGLVGASRSAAPRLWNAYTSPLAFALPLLFHFVLLAFPVALLTRRRALPFLFSSIAVLALFGILAQGLYPDLLPALGTPERSLTVHGTRSSETTLSAMLVIAVIGVPAAIAYTVFIYSRFRGRVVVDEHGY